MIGSRKNLSETQSKNRKKKEYKIKGEECEMRVNLDTRAQMTWQELKEMIKKKKKELGFLPNILFFLFLFISLASLPWEMIGKIERGMDLAKRKKKKKEFLAAGGIEPPTCRAQNERANPSATWVAEK